MTNEISAMRALKDALTPELWLVRSCRPPPALSCTKWLMFVSMRRDGAMLEDALDRQ